MAWEKKAEDLEVGDTVRRDGYELEVIGVDDITSEIDGPGESDPNRHIHVQFRDPDDPDEAVDTNYNPDDDVEVVD